MTGRSIFIVALALLGFTAAEAQAQATYPNRPIRVLTPFSAGGGSDILARLIGPQITEAWGQQVIVENRPGAAGNLGAGIVVKAEPDGYTLIIVSGTYGASGALYKLPYDTVTAITPIILIGTTPLVLSNRSSSPRSGRFFTGRKPGGKLCMRINIGEPSPVKQEGGK